LYGFAARYAEYIHLRLRNRFQGTTITN
jgi:hypothetical protein